MVSAMLSGAYMSMLNEFLDGFSMFIGCTYPTLSLLRHFGLFSAMLADAYMYMLNVCWMGFNIDIGYHASDCIHSEFLVCFPPC